MRFAVYLWILVGVYMTCFCVCCYFAYFGLCSGCFLLRDFVVRVDLLGLV